MSRSTYSPLRSQGYGGVLDGDATALSSSHHEPSPRRPMGMGGSPHHHLPPSSSSPFNTNSNNAAAATGGTVPAVDLSYYERYKSFGTQEYQSAFAITALAEIVLDTVLTETPDNPLRLMANTCKKWSDAAFEEAERLYGDEAMLKSRSASPAATNTNHPNASGSSPGGNQHHRGSSVVHIVGGRPSSSSASQQRAASASRVPGQLTHPPVLPWIHARPQLPAGIADADAAPFPSPSAVSPYSSLSDPTRNTKPSLSSFTAVPTLPPYWARPMTGKANNKSASAAGPAAKTWGNALRPAAGSNNAGNRPAATNSNNNSSSIFTFACKDYVQRHRIACIIDEWFFAVTAQKPFSPALFSYNYFRQRDRMRLVTRQEEELGTQLTDEEKERAHAIMAKRLAEAEAAAAAEQKQHAADAVEGGGGEYGSSGRRASDQFTIPDYDPAISSSSAAVGGKKKGANAYSTYNALDDVGGAEYGEDTRAAKIGGNNSAVRNGNQWNANTKASIPLPQSATAPTNKSNANTSNSRGPATSAYAKATAAPLTSRTLAQSEAMLKAASGAGDDGNGNGNGDATHNSNAASLEKVKKGGAATGNKENVIRSWGQAVGPADGDGGDDAIVESSSAPPGVAPEPSSIVTSNPNPNPTSDPLTFSRSGGVYSPVSAPSVSNTPTAALSSGAVATATAPLIIVPTTVAAAEPTATVHNGSNTAKDATAAGGRGDGDAAVSGGATSSLVFDASPLGVEGVVGGGGGNSSSRDLMFESSLIEVSARSSPAMPLEGASIVASH